MSMRTNLLTRSYDECQCICVLYHGRPHRIGTAVKYVYAYTFQSLEKGVGVGKARQTHTIAIRAYACMCAVH